MIVAVEMRRGRLARRKRRDLARALFEARAAEDERVHPAVVIGVDQRHAGAVGLDDESLAIDAAVDRRRLQPGARADVSERDRPGAIVRRRHHVASKPP